MEFGSQISLVTDNSLEADKKPAPNEGCSSCSLRKTCIPSNFNARQVMQFEHLVKGKRRVACHASLYRKHDKLGMLYVVRFGQFKLLAGGLVSEQTVVGFHMPGDLVGLDAIATGRHNFRLMALEDSEVCEIPFSAMTELMGAEPSMQTHVLQRMSEALSHEYRRSFLLATASIDERFASFLLRLGEKYARFGYSDKSFRLSMSRGDIGNFLGTTVESISRMVARFNRQGAVSIRGRMVELRDLPFLQAVGRAEQTVELAGWQPEINAADATTSCMTGT